MLDIFTSYHCMQFQGKGMIQTQQNGKNSHFGPDLDLLGPNFSCQFFFFKNLLRQSLDIMVSYYYVKYQEKK